MAPAMTAPVFPAEMNASDSPAFCSSSATLIDDFRLPRIAASGLSPISMTSGASMTVMRPSGTFGCRARAASISARRPTSWTS